jgi:hypothetical protein
MPYPSKKGARHKKGSKFGDTTVLEYEDKIFKNSFSRYYLVFKVYFYGKN